MLGNSIVQYLIYHQCYILYEGLARGTILYVVMFEVLQREQEKEVTGIFHIIGIILGFSAMLVVELIGYFVYKNYFLMQLFYPSP